MSGCRILMRKKLFIFGISVLLLLILVLSSIKILQTPKFNGMRAYNDIITQVAFGPRILGSYAHEQEEQFISETILNSGWNLRYQDAVVNETPIRNIIGYRQGQEDNPTILLGTHYDSRLLADKENSSLSSVGVPGANDGASGVAVLLELIRSLPENSVSVWMVFFDAEDNYGLKGLDGSVGSRIFVQSLGVFPRSVIIVDMVGDKDLSIYYESNSDLILSKEIWSVANNLGYTQFVPVVKYALLDDHMPFLEAGIPAVLIIDFDYPYWHTTSDTSDKVSPDSLDVVGDTLWTWIVNQTH
jgi:glutaminyl-peptide cyclotransferase